MRRRSSDGEIVIEVEVDGGDVFVWLHAELEQLLPLIEDSILL